MQVLLTPTPLIALEIQEYENTVIWANKLTLWEGDNFKEPIVFSCRKIEILGTVDKGVIDFDCEPYIKFTTENAQGDDYGDKFFWDYEDECFGWDIAEESFTSLLSSHSLSLDKKYLIIKQK